jgi:release factor glutamine methyltransferase
MTIDEWVQESTKKLSKAGIESARLDCLLILQSVSGQDKNWLLTHGDKIITEQALKQFNDMLDRREKREPLAYITGKKEFYGLDFLVTPDVLIPRPETEALVTHLIKNAPINSQVLDMGTGSGCIAVAAKKQRADINITASDTSARALAVAQENAASHKAQINFVKSNLFDDIDGKFSVIAANLPYVPHNKDLESELYFEPEIALFAEDDGLDIYHKFFLDVEDYLADNGLIIIEHDPKQFSWLLAYTHRRAQRVSNFVTALS